MQNTLPVSIRLILLASMLTVLAACNDGGDSNDGPLFPPTTPPPAVTNAPPVLAAIGAQSVEEVGTLSFDVSATDPDATTPTLAATGLPTGATFDAATGKFNWATVAGDAANSPYSVTFTATDGADPAVTVNQTVSITVTAVAVMADCSVSVTSPAAGTLTPVGDAGVQAATATLGVEATFTCSPNIPAGWGVKFAVVGANGSAGEEIVTSEPFIATIINLEKDTYTVTATVVDEAEADVSGAATVSTVNDVALGDYYIAIGDSITSGVGDDIDTDDVSIDGRNTSPGYTPILNDRLTAVLQYPHTVVAVGAPGSLSAEGVNDVAQALNENPDAQRVLIKYGMNDAGPPYANSVPSGLNSDPATAGSFKANMEQIIDVIVADGKQPILAKINVAWGDSANSGRYSDPVAVEGGQRNVNIREYNQVIDQLRTEKGITIVAPDFYDLYFTNQRYTRQYSDNIHPNGEGYKNMANAWCAELVTASVAASCTPVVTP